jgi:hypothetical protein
MSPLYRSKLALPAHATAAALMKIAVAPVVIRIAVRFFMGRLLSLMASGVDIQIGAWPFCPTRG